MIKHVLHQANFFARREAKNKSWQCDWSAKKFAAKKFDQFLLFHCSREQIRLVENGFKTGLRKRNITKKRLAKPKEQNFI
jgi:hypothetical protein